VIRAAVACAAALACLPLIAARAHAYSYSSPFAFGCHEHMSERALRAAA
jgi:hypothetical protein